MNRKQAREIAKEASKTWGFRLDDAEHFDVIADALHAAYEPELDALRAQVAKRDVSPSVIDLSGDWAPDPKMDEWRRNAARLASIKETARRILASEFAHPEFVGSTPEWLANGFSIHADTILAYAESFEDAFERRYGGKP